MITKTVVVNNKEGMHMRPAGLLAKAASAHKNCDVTLNANGKTVNAKAVIQIMSACIRYEDSVEISCDGENEDKVMEEIISMFENGFGE